MTQGHLRVGFVEEEVSQERLVRFCDNAAYSAMGTMTLSQIFRH